ncbi:polysaccharide biosynthesis/export family protein [Salipiger aestuarii]|uniref:Polysaccharide export outer membrane protein n=1 Tax=Salipiger aestuarii TaxID=568098 RepID=A0A327YRX3_9RHOB|nr:polysaccharide biosynthesis/export family protein [Salipiger aestuarii]EIE51168.1 polysaccharide biosynthesis/export protein family [Citreicella sp. 357]RAK23934.1 polysaccharide export outer membrane protein [Salipiger aestuarii]
MVIKGFKGLAAAGMLLLGACGIAYQSPSVNPLGGGDTKVRVLRITPESAIVANRAGYAPKELPSIFFNTAGGGAVQPGGGAAPAPVVDYQNRPSSMQTRVPPAPNEGPYRIGVGDVLLLATPQIGSTVEQLTGLLAAANSRQGYTVQDDGAIAIPHVGRVPVSGSTLEEAENTLFQRLVETDIEPTFSLEVAEFNSKKVSIGGAVQNPSVAPITLTPLYLDEALAAAGGVNAADLDYASVRIYRDGTIYQIPLDALYSNRSLARVQLTDGDVVFVDTAYELDRAQAYFEERIRLAEFRQGARIAALNELNAEVGLRRGALGEARDNYMTRLELDSVDRDYVYLTGEVDSQARYALPFGRTASLADALYENGGVPTQTGNVREIYVLRGSPDPREFGAITAWQLDGRDAASFLLATRFEMRPNDVIFVAEQPVTRWSRVISQITPSLVTYAASAASN